MYPKIINVLIYYPSVACRSRNAYSCLFVRFDWTEGRARSILARFSLRGVPSVAFIQSRTAHPDRAGGHDGRYVTSIRINNYADTTLGHVCGYKILSRLGNLHRLFHNLIL